MLLELTNICRENTEAQMICAKTKESLCRVPGMSKASQPVKYFSNCGPRCRHVVSKEKELQKLYQTLNE
jgi:hypothetical protein